jgi:acylglycerol lipase
MKCALLQSMALLLAASVVGVLPVQAVEMTLPGTLYKDEIKPELAAKYKYTEDGDFTKSLGLPTYEWMPEGQPLQAIVIGVHGLTLHGRSYRVLARALAVNGLGFVSMDMRGFGRCKFDEKKQFSTHNDNKATVNHEKSYEELVQLAKLVRQKYPGLYIVVLGESLGCTFCVRLAGEHHELVDGIVLSAPAVKVNPKMYAGGSALAAGTKAALFTWDGVMDLHSFINTLVSQRPEVSKEMLDDPMILKQLPLTTLISTDAFVEKTSKWGKTVDAHLPILILQGSNDRCVSAKRVTDLMDSMPSDDQTLAWRGKYGHLQLETSFIRAAMIDALIDWFTNHGVDNEKTLATLRSEIEGLGGHITK